MTVVDDAGAGPPDRGAAMTDADTPARDDYVRRLIAARVPEGSAPARSLRRLPRPTTTTGCQRRLVPKFSKSSIG